MLDTTEEERLESAQRWWKENGQSTIIGVVLGIVIILSWQYWQEYKHTQAEQASALYAQLLKAVETNANDNVQKLADQIQNAFPKTDYALFSGLLQAQLKAQQNDVASAKQILTKIGTSSNKELSNVAKIRLVRLMLANKEYEQGLQLINGIDPASSVSFSSNYDELVGDLYVALNRLDQARTSYQTALRNGSKSPLLQLKIDDLTAPERVEAKK
ncbi:MAG: tetratricopeptide repeat protein [Methylococcales bacterium]|nr:tetratricopeptide repeat protein [Methylococcales bacterium]